MNNEITRHIVLFAVLFSAFSSLKAQENKLVEVLTPTEFKEAIQQKDAQLVDVRTAREFEEGSIQNALNVDYFLEEEFSIAFEKLDKNQPIYIYCRSGNRSAKSAIRLQEMGFQKIYDLEGGFMSWPFESVKH
jgi:rhodanese-related sulfurtransferase